MNHATQMGKTIQESFNYYHKNNPLMYDKFKGLAFEAINRGKKKISFKMIMNAIRWNIFLETTDDEMVIEGKPRRLKINDAYGSRYARLFIKDYPQHEDKIEFRKLRSQ